MVQTLIRGSTQILDASITVAKLVAGWDAEFVRRGGTVPLTADWGVGNFKLTGVADGLNPQDAVNIRTMQAFISGVGLTINTRGVQTVQQALSGLPTIDGVTYIAGDEILLTAQTVGAQNGPWVTAAGSWTRPAYWAAASAQHPAGFRVQEGTTFGDTRWTMTTNGTITVDTTAVTIIQDTSGAFYTAGNGLLLTGNSFSVKNGDGIGFDGSQNTTVILDANGLLSKSVSGVRIAAGTSAQFIVANGSGNPAWVAMSGDVTITNAGAATVNHVIGTGFLKYTDLVYAEVPTGLINSSNTAYTLVTAPINTSLKLLLNGVTLQGGAGNDYTIAGAAITMLFVPQTGDKLLAYYTK